MKGFKYALGIIFPVIGVLLFFVAFFVFLSSKTYIMPIILITVGALLIIFSKNFRIKARQDYEFDKYGNSKKKYSSLSQEDRKVIDMAIMAENQTILSEAEFSSMLHPGSKNPDKELNDLIGLENVKETVEKLKAQMQFNDRKNSKAFHMCFLGNPGTGKTTVAKILTGILYKNKYIKKNEYICTDSATIMSAHDSRKMKLILNKAHNRVLFIDEAYALAYDTSGAGQQILAMLLNEMENSRDNMIVILAGYKNEMKMLFQLNEGLASRINTYLFFEDYDQAEMGEILKGLATKDGYLIESDAFEMLINVLLYKKCLPFFANGRTVRKTYEKTLQNHYYNLSSGKLDKSYRFTITKEDVSDNDLEDKYLV